MDQLSYDLYQSYSNPSSSLIERFLTRAADDIVNAPEILLTGETRIGAERSPLERLALGASIIPAGRALLGVKGVKFTQSAADDLVIGLKKTYGGNVTVMKNGKPVFRVHQPGSHGNVNATITKFKQGTNPNSGRIFNIPDKKVFAFDEEIFNILNQASRGKGGYSLVTKGGR